MLSVMMVDFADGTFKVEDKPLVSGDQYQVFSIIGKTCLKNVDTDEFFDYIRIVKTDTIGMYDRSFYDYDQSKILNNIGLVSIFNDKREVYKF